MQHWNRLPRYYALKDSTLHEQSIWASLRTISFDFFLSHPASLLLILTSCVNTRKEDRELPSYTNKSTYFIRFVHILSFFSSIYTLLRIFFIMHWELGHSIQSSGTKDNSKPRHVPSRINQVIAMSNNCLPRPLERYKWLHFTKENMHDNCIYDICLDSCILESHANHKGTTQFWIKTSILVHLMTPLVIYFLNGIHQQSLCICWRPEPHFFSLAFSPTKMAFRKICLLVGSETNHWIPYYISFLK